MTAASGALGHMFRKNVAYINIRPERLTHEYVDETGVFALNFPEDTPESRKILKYLGTVSGKTEDKLSQLPLTVSYSDGIPYFNESRYVFLCRVLYKAPYISDGFTDKSVEDYYYPKRDYHDLYIADIFKVFVQNE